jgi:hypothetical protein
MSNQVDNSFIQLYEAEVKAAYQREGAMLRNTCRVRQQIGAERIYFPTLGKGETTQKARHADVTPMNLDHGREYADMRDEYAPEYIDDLDQAKINWSLRQDYSNASGWALGRATDDQILSAANQTSNVEGCNQLDSSASKSITKKVLTGLTRTFNDRDVPLDRRRWAVISPTALEELQDIMELTSTDYAREKILVSGSEPVFFMGWNWMCHTAVEDIGGTGTKGFFWHFPALGYGVCQDIQTKVDWVPQKVAWLVNSWMSHGATIIDGDGVTKLVDDNP